MNTSHDSLDYQKELYQRAQSGHPTSNILPTPANQNQIYKNFYKQELDDFVRQKNQQKRIEKERQSRQRNLYNQRINYSIEAEKIKDLSYKNYYQMLSNNHSNITKNFITPYHDRDIEKEKLIINGIQQQRHKSQLWHQQQQARNDELKKMYRQHLAGQINEKYSRGSIEMQNKTKQQQQFMKMTYTPLELAKFDRERKINEMQKYKEDLDKLSPTIKQRSLTGPYNKNDFNVLRVEDRHNPMINPLPYNIQNPYILKEMRRKQTIDPQQEYLYANRVI